MTTGLFVGVNSGAGIVWTNRYEYTDMIGLTVNDGLGATSDSAAWIMRFPIKYVNDGNELPLGGQVFRIEVGGTKVFEGVIEAPANRWLHNGATIEVDYTGASYVRLLDRHLVVESGRDEERAGSRIKWILKNFADGFDTDTSHIKNGPFVPDSNYDYEKVSSAISSVASMTNYMWYVDYDKAIHFFADLDHDAPITAIDLDTDTTIGDCEVIQDASGIANVIILKDFSSKGKDKYSDEQTADGNSSFFKLPLPPFSVEDTDVYVKPEGGTAWTQKTAIADPLGTASDAAVSGPSGLAYVCVMNWGVRLPTNQDGTPSLGAGDTVKTEYNPEVPDRIVVVFDEDSITEMARREGGDGQHEMTVSVSDFRVESDKPVLSLGHLMLSRKAWPITYGSFIVRTQTVCDWMPGDTFTIISTKRDIFDVKQWVSSGYSNKNPVRVWVTNVERQFEVHNDGIWEKDVVYFSSQPYEAG